MKIPLKILLVEDSESDAGLNVRALEAAGYQVSHELVANAEDMASALKKQSFDLVISDHNMPQFESRKALALLQESGRDIPFIVVSGTIGEETAVSLMKAGAQDYVMKNNLSRLAPVVQRELREAEDRRERTSAERALKESEERFRLIFEQAPDAYYLNDLKGHFLDGNRAAERLMGYDRNELIGQSFLKLHLLSLDQIPRAAALLVRNAMGRSTGPDEFLLKRKDGSEVTVEIRTHPIRFGDTSVVLGIARDVTERIRNETQLRTAYGDLRKAIDASVLLLASTVEARDPYTAGHQKKVAKIAEAIAGEMGLPKDQVQGIHMAGIIHDLGKIAVPAEILSKPGRLSSGEFAIIKTHSQVGYDILNPIRFPWPLAQIVLQHHERMDGSGYPQGISDGAIRLEARILAVADVVEAMSSHRPYRASLGIGKALGEIEANKARLYDPQVADACLTLFRDKGFRADG